MTTFSLSSTPVRPAAGALYRAVWRWHFYAGVLAVPVALWLAVTGAIYLWRPQYEAWKYRELLNVPAEAKTLSADAQLQAAVHSQPWWATAVSFTPSAGPGRTSETVFRMDGRALMSVFVNPHTGAVVGTRYEADRVMDRVRLLHGELLAGKTGRIVVELVASWMALLLLTGVYLWWPRPRFQVWGFLLPRLRAKGRVFWRDVHAVPAMWLAGGALFQLATSVPGSRVAGSWWRAMAQAVGAGPAVPVATAALHSELSGWTPPRIAKSPIDAMAGASSAAGFGPRGAATPLPPGVVPPTPLTLDRIIGIAQRRGLGAPYAIILATDPTDVVRLLSNREVLRGAAYLQLDQYSGRVLGETGDRQIGGWGRIARWSEIGHEGWLAGRATQVLGTVACAGVFLMAVSGLALWWQRRPRAASWLAPAPLPRRVLAGMVALGVALPLLGASVVLMLAVDAALAWRLPAARLRAEPALR